MIMIVGQGKPITRSSLSHYWARNDLKYNWSSSTSTLRLHMMR